MNTAAFVALVDKMADVIIENEVHFCDMDSCGDGDFGMSIAKGFRQLKKDWATRDKANIGAFLTSASDIIMEYCGGASGPIWGSGFRYAGKAAGNADELDATLLGKILQGAVKGVQTTGERSFGHGAVVGDKTLIDALVPCADEVTKAAEEGDSLFVAMEKGARAAVKGAEYTKQITARLGRALSAKSPSDIPTRAHTVSASSLPNLPNGLRLRSNRKRQNQGLSSERLFFCAFFWKYPANYRAKQKIS